MPIHGRRLLGLTGKCGCSGCIAETVKEATKQGKDIVQHVSHELVGLAKTTTTRADLGSHSPTGSADHGAINITGTQV